MELSQSERMRLVVRWLATEKGVNQSDIGQMVGYPNNTYFSNLLSGRKPIVASLVDKIAALDPRINIDFLSGVSDEMLLGEGAIEPPVREERPAAPRVGIYVPPEFVEMVTDLTAVVREQQKMINNLVSAWLKMEDEGR